MVEVTAVTPTPTMVPVTTTAWTWFESVFWLIVLIIILVIVYLIIKEVRLMRNTARLAEIDLEKEKIHLMKAEMAQRGTPFFRVAPEKMEEIRNLEDDNVNLETDIFAKHSAVDKRIARLENMVKVAKLDGLVARIKEEEKKFK